ncbi:MAG: ATP-dependent helicase RecG, partial [Thermodesulfobacteriota bacterium]|nr:ATP-dependent helicase RecG [Thermodesulfobacteriota bacterium]
MGLFDVLVEQRENRKVIKISLASGPEKPYYIRKFGMSEKGCFIRIGSASEPMDNRMIDNLFSRRTRNTVGSILSPRTDLTFEQLKIYYQEIGMALNDKFLNNLELLTTDRKLNYAAYLLADENGMSIKVAKYAHATRVELIESNEYGYCSMIKATKRVLDKLEIENRTFTKITPREREQRRMIDPTAMREAVIKEIVA